MSTNFNENISATFTKIITCEMSYFMRIDGQTDGRTDGLVVDFRHRFGEKASRKKAARRVITGSKFPTSCSDVLG
jgi:hypothetical protein